MVEKQNFMYIKQVCLLSLLKYFTCPGCIIRICFAKFATNAASGDEVTMNSRLVFRHTKLWVRITSHCGVLFS